MMRVRLLKARAVRAPVVIASKSAASPRAADTSEHVIDRVLVGTAAVLEPGARQSQGGSLQDRIVAAERHIGEEHAPQLLDVERVSRTGVPAQRARPARSQRAEELHPPPPSLAT